MYFIYNKSDLPHLESVRDFWNHKLSFAKTEEDKEEARLALQDINNQIAKVNK